MLATYHLGEVFLSIMWFFLFFIWIILLFQVFSDLFRDHETSGWAKALWVLFILVMPYLGVLVYLIARGRSMNERNIAAAKQSEAAFRDYVQDAAGTSASPADELAKLAALRDQGTISAEEFDQAKAKVLS